MKVLFTLAIVILSSLAIFSQTYIGRALGSAFFIDNVKRTKNHGVTFNGIITPDTNDKYIDPDNSIKTKFRANCLSMAFTAISYEGFVHGEFRKGIENVTGTADQPMVIWYAIDAACKAK